MESLERQMYENNSSHRSFFWAWRLRASERISNAAGSFQLNQLAILPTLAAYVFGVWLVLVSGLATAQTIESLQWVDGARQDVARITFNASVRFLRQAPVAHSDLAQLSFQIVAADEAVLGQSVEEGKRLERTAGKVGIALTYVPMPAALTKLLTLRFTGKVRLQARQGPGARTIDLAFVGEDGVDSGLPMTKPLPPMADVQAERRYALLLQSFSLEEQGSMPRIPAELQDYAVFTRTFEEAGVKRFALTIGYFRTEEDAESVRQRVVDRFPLAQVIKLETAPTLQAVVNATASQAVLPVAEPVANAASSNSDSALEVHRRASELLGIGISALGRQRWQEAVEAFNQTLTLPPNPSSQQAQELVGAAWEGLNQPAKARIEYQLYLRLYPQGEAAQRVALRLEALGGVAAIAQKATEKTDGKGDKPNFSSTGSISQYYYGGKTKTDSLVNISAGIDQNTLSRTNQSALVTSVDYSGRYRAEGSETKLVVRGTASRNFMASSNAQNLTSAAFLDYRDLSSRLDVRVGRQSAIAGSMFGLFDGVSLTVPIAGKFKLDAMAGVPANTLVSAPSQRLAGLMLEADSLFDHWGGNISLLDQSTEGISDRRAVGLEIRYFGDFVSMYSQLDYDLNFRVLNAATVQGSVQGPFDTTITVLLDNRKAPSLQLSDALISSGTTSLKTLLQQKSLAEVSDMALGTAAQARQALLSVSRAISPKWQGSVDFRYSDVGALPAVGDFQAMAATGAQYNISLQLTGSNLYSGRDISGINLSLLKSDTLSGIQLAYNNLTGFLDNKASIEPSIRLYTQRDNTATTVLRVSPGLRLSYKVTDRASLLGEAIVERSKTDGPTNHEDSSSVFFYAGYRYDFF